MCLSVCFDKVRKLLEMILSCSEQLMVPQNIYVSKVCSQGLIIYTENIHKYFKKKKKKILKTAGCLNPEYLVGRLAMNV